MTSRTETDSTERGGARRLLAMLIAQQRKPLFLALIASVVWTVASVAGPLLVQRAIDHGIEPGRTGTLVVSGVLIVALALVAGATYAAWSYAGSLTSRSVEADLRERLFAQLQRLHVAYHDRTATGQLMGRMNSDLQQVQVFVENVPNSAAASMLGVGIVIVLVVASPLLALLALASFPLLAIAIAYYRRLLYPAARGVQQQLGALSGLVEDSVAGIRVIKGLGAERVQRANVRVVAGEVYDSAVHWAGLRAAYLPIFNLVPAIAAAVVLGVGGHLVLDGRLTIGELVAFNAYLGMLVWPVANAGNMLINYQRALASAGRSAEVLSTEPAIGERPGARALPEGGGEVQLDHVLFSYPGHRDRAVLDGLDLLVPAGTSIALVGPTGSGKSTIAQLIARLYDVDGGAVRLDGVDVRELRLHDLRRAIGLVFQETFLFADTVYANIAFGDPDAPPEDVEWAARVAGAHEFLTALPDGYDTVIGERGFSLSGGQRQRIAIARTLITEPKVLILDDATSAVDPTKEGEIRDALQQVMTECTTIVIAHRLATIALADRVALLAAGRVAAVGTHAELLASSELYRAALEEAGT
jgi:ATP-binding cassette, subfamily B, bacterial